MKPGFMRVSFEPASVTVHHRRNLGQERNLDRCQAHLHLKCGLGDDNVDVI